jgi:hypothetical protein
MRMFLCLEALRLLILATIVVKIGEAYLTESGSVLSQEKFAGFALVLWAIRGSVKLDRISFRPLNRGSDISLS